MEYATGLGLLVEALGKAPDEVMCRGGWTELERKDDILRITFETAWTPCYEVTDLMGSRRDRYLGMRLLYPRCLSPRLCLYPRCLSPRLL